MSRVVCHFSCGAASAVAAKLAIAKYGHDRVILANAFIEEELDDNRRFLSDCEAWLEHSVTVLRDTKYGASVLKVWGQKRFIKGIHGAPCAQHLKRELLDTIRKAGDIDVLGYTIEEQGRLDDIRGYCPDRTIESPLIEKNLSKNDCYAILDRANILLPEMYRLGFDNANCPLCPKGGQGYWQAIRRIFPNNFTKVVALQDELGEGSYFLRFRSGPRKNERMSLRELPDGDGDPNDGMSFACSFFCQMAEEDIASDAALVAAREGRK